MNPTFSSIPSFVDKMLEILNSTVSSLQTSKDIDVLVVTSISNQLQLYMEAWKYSSMESKGITTLHCVNVM